VLQSVLNHYLASLRRTLKGGDATERSYYPALKALLESSDRAVEAVSEPRRRACGAPDFHVRKRRLPIGHLEAKDLGTSLDEAERSEQIAHRYRPALPNLVLTNFLEFRWYVRGEHRRTARLGEISGSTITTTRAGRAELAALLAAFLSAEPQGADNARDLATRLARLAHEIRNVIVEGFARDHISADTADLRDAVHKELVPDLDEAQFADLFAQTLAYGFFAAWVHHPDGAPFERSSAAADIPKTSPFLRRIFDIITGAQLDEEPFAGYVDDLVQLLRATDKAAILEDFLRATGREDPVVHFYETFLQAYDPRTRELRGVYYTPEPVVSYMVRSVDHLLRTRFGLPNGLADTAQVEYEVEGEDGEKVTATGPRVLILDPACGTGTFLYEIVSHIRDRFLRKRQAGAWSSYVREHLLPRLFGFELLCLACLEDERRFGALMERFAQVSLRITTAWSQVEGLHAFILHDDLTMSSGPVFSPAWYRRHIFAHCPPIFRPLLDKGVPIIFTSDGDCPEFVDDVFAAGAEGLNFEYLVDLGSLVERYPDKILIGNLNSSTLARGPREAITREVRACMEVGARARRFVVNVGGGLTHDIPVEHLEHYLSLRKELARSLRAR
jgi:hypothetical protein